MSSRTALPALLMLIACPVAFAQSAYISQVNSHASGAISPLVAQPMQTVPVFQYTPSQTAFVPTPTPEMTVPHNGNIAQTLEIGRNNAVYQGQSGGNNFSNVSVIGSNSNAGVLQGGKDFSNVALINMRGYSVWVLQPPNAPPVNELIARLPNGSLLIKR
ncbi:MAG TPA: hypothetical protein VMU69_06560 [Bradyrhizobium sp.]|nr:hypothetical protein [Bradyrhizobium sp.]